MLKGKISNSDSIDPSVFPDLEKALMALKILEEAVEAYRKVMSEVADRHEEAYDDDLWFSYYALKKSSDIKFVDPYMDVR